MREIPEPNPLAYWNPYKPCAATCPNCKGPMSYGPVNCPDGKPGCLVAHNGYVCNYCGKHFQ